MLVVFRPIEFVFGVLVDNEWRAGHGSQAGPIGTTDTTKPSTLTRYGFRGAALSGEIIYIVIFRIFELIFQGLIQHLSKALFGTWMLAIIVVPSIAAAMPVTLLLPDTKQFDALLAL